MTTSTVSDFTRRTMRSWAVFEVIYGVIFALVIAVYLPWKSPLWNVGLIAYCVAHVASAPGLWTTKRWGWRVATIAGTIGFVLAIGLCALLIGSYSYLKAVYGDFGRGASIGALLFASVALQVLGLYPALLCRAMLRREVRADMGVGKTWGRALLGLLAVPLITGVAIGNHYQMQTSSSMSELQRDTATQYVRAAIEGRELPDIHHLETVQGDGYPTFVTLWIGGEPRFRTSGDGDTFADALEEATAAMVELTTAEDLAPFQGRVVIDRVIGTAPVLSEQSSILALSVDPGMDGLTRGDEWILPGDLVKRQVFGKEPLVPGIREIRLGMHVEPILETLGSEGQIYRVRTESWVEWQRDSLVVSRANTPAPGRGPETWRNSAVAAGDFVLRQVMDDGRFQYQYFPHRDHHPPPGSAPYSIPRHAGTVYSLALLFEHTGADRFREGAEKAIGWLNERVPPECGGPDKGCVVDGNSASMGSTALATVGMLQYQRSTRDARFQGTIVRLLEFIIYSQRDNGDFWHEYSPKNDAFDKSQKKMFYSEEAALALVMGWRVLGDRRYLDAAEKAMDYLTGPKYEEFFLGGFVYGADHWTCIAAEEAYPDLDATVYVDFCEGYAEFMRRLQYEPEMWPAGFDGHYGFSALLVPQAPAAAGFTEAIISTYQLAAQHGRDTSGLRTQLDAALDALSRDQIRIDNAWMMPNPRAAHGAIRRSLVEDEVRIDFTQHALSALIRGSVARFPQPMDAPKPRTRRP